MGELKSKVEGNVNEAIGKAKKQSNDPETRAEGRGQEDHDGHPRAQELHPDRDGTSRRRPLGYADHALNGAAHAGTSPRVSVRRA